MFIIRILGSTLKVYLLSKWLGCSFSSLGGNLFYCGRDLHQAITWQHLSPCLHSYSCFFDYYQSINNLLPTYKLQTNYKTFSLFVSTIHSFFRPSLFSYRQLYFEIYHHESACATSIE